MAADDHTTIEEPWKQRFLCGPCWGYTARTNGKSSVNHVKYFGVIFDKRITWSLHIEMTEAKAIRTFIRIYSLFKSERSSTNIKLTLHRALIRSVMPYACSTWEFVADTHHLKLQHIQNKILHIIGNFPRCTLVHNFTWLSSFHIHMII
jgi:hypothetical protein